MGFKSTRDEFSEVSADRGSKHATCEQKIAAIRIIAGKSFALSRAIKQRIASRWLPLKLRSIRLDSTRCSLYGRNVCNAWIAVSNLSKGTAVSETLRNFSIVGRSVPRVDGVDKVTGRAKYTGDLIVPGMIEGKFLRSPYAHARIRSIDTA